MAVTINGVSPTTAQQREFAAAMGLPVLLQTVTVGTAQQDIDFTSLDLDADSNYQIFLAVKPNTTGDQTVYAYYNADTTNTNYQTQFLTTDNTTNTAGRASAPIFAFGNVTATTTQTLQANANFAKISGAVPICDSISADTIAGSIRFLRTAVKWNSTANVTSIKLRHTSNFGAGTVAKIYKV